MQPRHRRSIQYRGAGDGVVIYIQSHAAPNIIKFINSNYTNPTVYYSSNRYNTNEFTTIPPSWIQLNVGMGPLENTDLANRLDALGDTWPHGMGNPPYGPGNFDKKFVKEELGDGTDAITKLLKAMYTDIPGIQAGDFDTDIAKIYNTETVEDAFNDPDSHKIIENTLGEKLGGRADTALKSHKGKIGVFADGANALVLACALKGVVRTTDENPDNDPQHKHVYKDIVQSYETSMKTQPKYDLQKLVCIMDHEEDDFMSLKLLHRALPNTNMQIVLCQDPRDKNSKNANVCSQVVKCLNNKIPDKVTIHTEYISAKVYLENVTDQFTSRLDVSESFRRLAEQARIPLLEIAIARLRGVLYELDRSIQTTQNDVTEMKDRITLVEYNRFHNIPTGTRDRAEDRLMRSSPELKGRPGKGYGHFRTSLKKMNNDLTNLQTTLDRETKERDRIEPVHRRLHKELRELMDRKPAKTEVQDVSDPNDKPEEYEAAAA